MEDKPGSSANSAGADAESDSRIESVLERMPAGYLSVGRDGVVQYANRRAAEVFVTSREQLVGQLLTDLLTDDDRTVLSTCRDHVRAQGVSDGCAVRIRKMEGQRWVWFDIASDGRGDDSDAGEVIVVSDISARKAAEAERDALAAQRQLALDAARLGWWRYDPVARYAWWDQRYREIFGVEGYERPNDEILARIHPDDLPGLWARVEAALDPVAPQPYAAEYRVRRPDGDVWVEAHGIATFEGEGETRRATMLVGTVEDITARKLADEALRESEAYYRTLFESGYDGVCLTDATSGVVLDCNSAFEALTGHAAGDLVGTRQAELHAPGNTRGSWLATALAEDAIRTRSGEIRWVETRARSLRFRGRDAVLTIYRDVTRELQERWEKDLSLGVLRLVQGNTTARELIREGTVLLQAATGCEAVGVRLRDGDDFPYYETRGFPATFVKAERSLCSRDAAGTIVRDAEGKALLDCMCGSILCGRVDPAQSFFTRGGSFWSSCTTDLLATTTEKERQGRTRNRCNAVGYESVALVPIRCGGEVVGLLQLNDRRRDRFTAGMIAFLETVTGQLGTALAERQSREAVRKSEESARALASNIPGMVYSGRPDWTTRFVSKSKELFGYPPEDLCSGAVCWRDLIHPEDRPAMEGEVDAFVRELGARTRTYRIRDIEGRYRWVEDHASPRFDADGTFSGVDGVVFDVTRERELEAQLRQAQRMESVGRLAGGIAHDFNNMITIMASCADFALDAVDLDAGVRADIEQIRAAASRAASLTRQLLAFSRRQVMAPRVLRLDKIVAGVEPMLHRLLGEDILIEVRTQADLGPVEADPGQIEQVIVNLAVNARDAMPEGGRLLIETANVDLGDEVTEKHLEAAPGLYVLLAMTDTGHGIPLDLRDRIFEPFFTTKEPGKGTGLGLATVFGIVKQSGGHIWVYSEPAQGATFKIFLPRAEARSETTPPSGPAIVAGGTYTILLAEDEEPVRHVVARQLRSAGYVVLAASDPAEAIRLAELNAVDLLVTDVVMPGTSGRQLVQELQRRARHLRVLYMSGYTENAIMHHGVLDPGTAFISKPFSKSELLAKVREVLQGR